MDGLTQNEFCLQIKVFLRSTQLYLVSFNVILHIIELPVSTLSRIIFKVEQKIWTFSKFAFLGLFQNVLTFNPMLPEARRNADNML